MVNLKKSVFLVASLALAVFVIASVSAFGSISSVEVNGVEALTGTNIASFAGDVLPVKVRFDATGSATDVRIKAWISGASGNSVATERFDVIANGSYVRFFEVPMPVNIDPSEQMKLEISVESRNGVADQEVINLAGQRESYVVEVLDVAMDNKVTAGGNLAVDVVLKNRGRHEAEDTFVRATIPALGIETRAYFGDMSPVDQSEPDKEDSAERRLWLRVPSNAPAGVYTVEIEAYNADSVTTTSKRLAVVGAAEESQIVSATNSKTFGAGETAVYTMTLINSGSNVRAYELVISASDGISVDADEPVVALNAGSGKTVKLSAEAAKPGKYNFVVNVYSNGALVKAETFTATVEGTSTKTAASNATVLLTVVLAIIFVVLLVVLIVLLTRRPEKKEDFGESYY